MDENFKLDIISPEKTLFSDDVLMVTIPAVEGDMGILKNHINLITFLKPGIINIQLKDKSSEELYVEEGTVEFSHNILTVLSSTVFKINELKLVGSNPHKQGFLFNFNKSFLFMIW